MRDNLKNMKENKNKEMFKLNNYNNLEIRDRNNWQNPNKLLGN